MESYLIYIGKAALAAGTFYLAYLALFQNQKQFVFNRIYLPVALALSFIIPLITFTTVKYIEAPATDANSFAFLSQAAVATETYSESPSLWPHYLFGLYLLGVAGFSFHLLAGHFNAIRIVQKSYVKNLFGSQVHITKKDVHPFSFFNKIVLSEKTLNSPNLKMIVAHESIHVKEKHTLDILYAEVMFLVQWFNPFAWLLKDAVKNNLEYKTDHEIVKTSDPQTYQLAMVALADKKGVAPFLTALNGSQLKNRIIMMKKKTENKFAPLKQLVILPLLAVLVMGLSNKEEKTEIVQQKASESTNVLAKNNLMASGTTSTNYISGSDAETNTNKFLLSIEFRDNQFILHGLEGCAFTELTFSANNQMPVAVNEFGMTSAGTGNTNEGSTFLFLIEKTDDLIKLTGKSGTAWKELTFSPVSQKHLINEAGVFRANIPDKKLHYSGSDTLKPPRVVKILEIDNENFENALYIVDGEEVENLEHVEPANVENVNVLKDEVAIDLYGEKGKNGVIVIQTKSGNDSKSGYSARVDMDTKSKNQIDNKVDVMPEFPGGETALKKYIDNSIVYPKRALKKGIIGTVYVEFVITKSGKVKDAKIARGVDPDLNKEALRVVNTLPLWKPGRKNGKPVDVTYTVPVDFDMKGYPRVKSVASGLAVPKPLYIVDGQETENIDDISPDDISSIDVLKGESGTKYYGEKGKDGVIIIQTKNYKENSQSELPVVLNGKITQLTLNEVDRDLIQNIKRIEPEEAVKKYGEKAKNGVFEITSRNVYTDKVKVKSSEEFKNEKITSELELRKFIANNIKYPIEAQEAGIHGLVATSIKTGENPEIISFGQYKNENSYELDEVVVVAYSKENTTTNPEKDSPILFREVERVIKMLPEIDIPKLKGKNIGIRVKFELQ